MSIIKVFKVSSSSSNLPVYRVYNKSVAERIKQELEEMFDDNFVVEEIEIQKIGSQSSINSD